MSVQQEDVLFGEICKKNGLIDPEQLEEAYHILDDRRAKGSVRSLEQVLVENRLLERKLASKVRTMVSAALDKSRRKEKKKERRERMLWSKAQLTDRSGSARRIGGYELLDELGTGAMGAVFRARQLSLNKIVALKLLLPKFARDRVYAERFMREARAAARLNHPNIILPFDVGCDDGYHWIAMEFVPGINAREKIDQDGPMEVKAAVRICVEVIKALGFAWKHSIIHRDVKPANIMLCDDGRVKLGDLGLARVDTGGELTQVGKCIGTPFYMAPEQAIDNRKIDSRCDIYSLGASLYHMVTGTVPYMGNTAAAVLTKHITEPLPDPREHRSDLPEPVVRVIGKMMAKDPDERYATAEEVLDDFKRLLAKKSVSAPALTPTSPTRPSRTKRNRGKTTRTVRRVRRESPTAPIAIGVIAFLALALLAWAVMRPRREPVRPDPGPDRPPAVATAEELAEEARERKAEARLRSARAQESPTRRIAELRMLAADFTGTAAAREAIEEAERLEAEVEASDRDGLRKLREEADELAEEGRLGLALSLLENSRGRFATGDARTELESAISTLQSRLSWRRVALETELDQALAARDFVAADSLLTVAAGDFGGREQDWLRAQRERLAARRDAPADPPPALDVEAEIERDVLFLLQLAELFRARRFGEVAGLFAASPPSAMPELAQVRAVDEMAVEVIDAYWRRVLEVAEPYAGERVRWALRDGSELRGRVHGLQQGRIAVAGSNASLLIAPWQLADAEVDELLGDAEADATLARLARALIDLYSGRIAAALETFDELDAGGLETGEFRMRAAILALILEDPGPEAGAEDSGAALPERVEPEPGPAEPESAVVELERLFSPGALLSARDGYVELEYDMRGGGRLLGEDWVVRQGRVRVDPYGFGLRFDEAGYFESEAMFLGEVSIELLVVIDGPLGEDVELRPFLADEEGNLLDSVSGLQVRRFKRGELRRAAPERDKAVEVFDLGASVLVGLRLGDGAVHSSVAGVDRSALEAPAELGAVRIGLIWDGAPVRLSRVRVRGRVDTRWALEKLADSE